jgi:hypothetical protein
MASCFFAKAMRCRFLLFYCMASCFFAKAMRCRFLLIYCIFMSVIFFLFAFFVFQTFSFLISFPPFFCLVFIALPYFPLLFHLCFASVFQTHVGFISSLPSLTCLGLKRLVVVVCKSNDVASCSYFRYNKAPFDIAPAPDSAPVTESDSL